MLSFEDIERQRIRSNTRQLVLKIKDGSKPLSSTGMIDTRLFNGENKLWAIRSDIDGLWFMKYDSGGLPEPLKQKFVTFNQLLTFTRRYFEKRNIIIDRVID